MKKRILKTALTATFPVLTGYLVLGFGFGILLSAAGYGPVWALFMSITMYAGAMQYVAVSLIAGGADLLTVAITTLMVNARHLFYGISLIDKYKGLGWRKIYCAFGLTDETYSLVCSEPPAAAKEDLGSYYFWVTLLDQVYWICGCVLGAAAGTVLPFNSQGIDFVLTALFLTIVTDQWLTAKSHVPAIIGLVSTALSLAVFGSENLLIPAMVLIAASLLLWRNHGGEEAL